MFAKVRETILSTRKFQKASIFIDHLGNTYVTLGFIDKQTHQIGGSDDEQIDTFSYNTFMQKDDKLLTIAAASLFDMRPMDPNQLLTDNWMDCKTTTLLFQTQPKTFRSFLHQNRGQFADKWVNIVEDKSFDAKLLTPRLILKISQNMRRLSVENLKWNEQNCNVADGRPKDQSKFVIKKAIRNDCIFDIDETVYQNSLITSICPLNQSQALLHLGKSQFGNRNNFSLLNYDTDYRQANWKHTPPKYETMNNKVLLLKNNKLFVNGSYSFDDHTSALKLFDLRVRGVVANLIQSSSDELIQLGRSQSAGSVVSPNFQCLSLNSRQFQIVSVLSYRGYSKSFPFIIDTRRPEKISLIKLQKHFAHLRELKMNNEKLMTIERQYHNAEFKSGQLRQYRLESL